VVLTLTQVKERDDVPCALNIDTGELLVLDPQGRLDPVGILCRGHGDNLVLSNQFLHALDLLSLNGPSVTLHEALFGVFVVIYHVLQAPARYTIWPFSSLQ